MRNDTTAVNDALFTLPACCFSCARLGRALYSNSSKSSDAGGPESFATDNTNQKLDIPVAVSVFPGELYRSLKLWGERVYSNLIYWNEVAKSGHFAALEQPHLFVAELRARLATLR